MRNFFFYSIDFSLQIIASDIFKFELGVIISNLTINFNNAEI